MMMYDEDKEVALMMTAMVIDGDTDGHNLVMMMLKMFT